MHPSVCLKKQLSIARVTLVSNFFNKFEGFIWNSFNEFIHSYLYNAYMNDVIILPSTHIFINNDSLTIHKRGIFNQLLIVLMSLFRLQIIAYLLYYFPYIIGVLDNQYFLCCVIIVCISFIYYRPKLELFLSILLKFIIFHLELLSNDMS